MSSELYGAVLKSSSNASNKLRPQHERGPAENDSFCCRWATVDFSDREEDVPYRDARQISTVVGFLRCSPIAARTYIPHHLYLEQRT